MFYGMVLVVHVIACLALIGIVLIQSGRGGGLSETFSSAESIFGTKTNTFLTRATTVFAVIFFITCLSLAFLSKQRSRSLLEGRKVSQQPPLKAEETKAPESATVNKTEPPATPPPPEAQTTTAEAQPVNPPAQAPK